MTITRVEVMRRATTVWKPGTVPYSQLATHSPDGYRCDCSGYVSMCWDLGAPGLSTVSLVTTGAMVEIDPNDLRPGDATGLCGPGTAGDAGHIQLVVAYDAGRLLVLEQRGGDDGPVRALYARITPGYRAYRYTGIREDETEMPCAWLAQDSTGIALVWPGASEVLTQNIGFVEAVAGWNAAGVPGPFAVPSIAGLGRTAPAVPIGAPGGSQEVPDHTHGGVER